jgi:hypothetical protein
LLGLACVTKPVLLPFVVFLLWKRELRFAMTTIISFAVLLLGPFVVLGGAALRDQLDIWRYWSNEYAPFEYAYGPKNVLARLFSPNPYAHPIVNAPALTTILWLAVVLVVALICAALILPRRFAGNSRDLFEIGLVASALLLVSPLTEYSYMIQLVIPLLGCYCCLLTVDWHRPRFLVAVTGTALIWLLLCVPLDSVNYPQVRGDSIAAALYRTLGPGAIYFYILLAAFALQLYLLHALSGRSTVTALRQFMRVAPALAMQWAADARMAVRGTPYATEQVTRAQASPRTGYSSHID